RVERAWENGDGLFTSVFTDYLARPTNPENLFETKSYEQLIEAIKSKFVKYNNHLAVRNSWREQHPMLFMSANLEHKIQDYLRQQPDI
ncbi:unnamed protein product, partial [Rhizoctonia solani]